MLVFVEGKEWAIDMSRHKLKEEFGIFLTYAENYPNHYEELLSSIVVD